MKSFLSIVLFSFFISKTLFSQDTIIKFNGEKIISKVMEIGDTEIKYKRFEMPDGPVYRELKSEIQTIKYAGGLKENFAPQEIRREEVRIVKSLPAEPSKRIEYYDKRFMYQNRTINEHEMQTLLINENDKKIFQYVQKAQQAKNLINIGFATIPFALAATYAIPKYINYAFLYNNSNDPMYTKSERNNYALLAAFCFAGSITCPIVSNVFSNQHKYYNRKAIELYNQRY